MTLTRSQQDAAAHRQLRERGVSEERIAELDADQRQHRQQQMAIARGEQAKPVAIGWCDEHTRYFRWAWPGCTPANVPTRAEIRQWFQHQRHLPLRQS